MDKRAYFGARMRHDYLPTLISVLQKLESGPDDEDLKDAITQLRGAFLRLNEVSWQLARCPKK